MRTWRIMRKVFKRIWRIRGENLCAHGEDAKRFLAYSPDAPRHIKLCNVYVSANNSTNSKFLRFFLSTHGMD
jgi:hypothetical protein